jgi:HlyD family secretion protein
MKKIIIALIIVGLTALNNEKQTDGYGNFEATEVTISAEANGKLSFEY